MSIQLPFPIPQHTIGLRLGNGKYTIGLRLWLAAVAPLCPSGSLFPLSPCSPFFRPLVLTEGARRVAASADEHVRVARVGAAVGHALKVGVVARLRGGRGRG